MTYWIQNRVAAWSARGLKQAAAVIVVALLAATSAGAFVLVGNLDTNPANTSYHTIKGPNGASGHFGETRYTLSFTVPGGSDYYLNSMAVIAKRLSGTSTSFDLAIYDNTGASGLPGAQVVSGALTVGASGVYETYSADFGSSTVLSAGHTYWAVIQSTAPTSDIQLALKRGISLNDPTRQAMFGNMGEFLPDGSPREPYWMYMGRSGFDVCGSPVPEPAGLLALAGGIVAMVGSARRRR